MVRNSKGFVQILIPIILLTLVAAFYLDNKYRLLQKVQYSSATPTPTVFIKDVIMDWKTYVNNNYKFKINYPADWKIEERSPLSEDAMPPSKITGKKPAYVEILEGTHNGIRISINPDGYFGFGYPGLTDSSKRVFIGKREVDVNIRKMQGGMEIREYKNFNLDNMSDFKIVVELNPAHSDKVLQILSTLNFNN